LLISSFKTKLVGGKMRFFFFVVVAVVGPLVNAFAPGGSKAAAPRRRAVSLASSIEGDNTKKKAASEISSSFWGFVTPAQLEAQFASLKEQLDFKFLVVGLLALVPSLVMFAIEALKTARVIAESEAFAAKAQIITELLKTKY
jgi:hypothetical protein